MAHLNRCRVFVCILVLVFAFAIAAVAAEFVGSAKSNVYHNPSCVWAKKISPKNLVHFSSAKDAQQKGYRPCKVCKPPSQD
jgi:methylphosphotriester-DNA--protein-cysteine methyltransferase